MIDELLLFHGLKQTGGRKMAGRCVSYATRWDPKTMSYKRKCIRRSGPNVGQLGAFGVGRGLKSSLAGVKDVFITGGIAAGGAVVTDRVFEMIQARLELAGYVATAAKAATGIALGLTIAKVLKKPRIGAAFAIGPIVVAALDIIHEITGTAGLGMMTVTRPPAYNPESMYAGAPALPASPNVGMVHVGPGVPDFLLNPAHVAAPAYPFAG